jgi:hypothetical protein
MRLLLLLLLPYCLLLITAAAAAAAAAAAVRLNTSRATWQVYLHFALHGAFEGFADGVELTDCISSY